MPQGQEAINTCVVPGQLTGCPEQRQALVPSLPAHLSSLSPDLWVKLHINPSTKIHQTNQLQTPLLPVQHFLPLHPLHTACPSPGTSKDRARVCSLPLSGRLQSKHSSKFAFCNPDFCKTVNLTSQLEKPPTGFIAWSYSARIAVLATSPSSALHLASTWDAELCRAEAGSTQRRYSIAPLHANFRWWNFSCF